MQELRNQLELLMKQAGGDRETLEIIGAEKSVFPFSEESRMMAYLLASDTITYEKYLELSREYVKRNKYLDLFDMAPRTFGETWGENHILSLFPEFVDATKESMASIYPGFDGEFDLWLDGIRVEVKACRASNAATRGSLASRAYPHSEAAANAFKYHYQQLKPSCCDIFIWIGVCRDELIYWVLTSDELKKTGKLGPQHRNVNTGISGVEVFEGQVFMTEEELSPFLVEEREVVHMVRRKGRQNRADG